MNNDDFDSFLPAEMAAADREIFENDDAALRSALAELQLLASEKAPEPTGELAEILSGNQKVNFVAVLKKKAPPLSGGIAGLLIAGMGLTGVAAASSDVRDFIYDSTIGVATHFVDDIAHSPFVQFLAGDGDPTPVTVSAAPSAVGAPTDSASPSSSAAAVPDVRTGHELDAAGLPNISSLSPAATSVDPLETTPAPSTPHHSTAQYDDGTSAQGSLQGADSSRGSSQAKNDSRAEGNSRFKKLSAKTESFVDSGTQKVRNALKSLGDSSFEDDQDDDKLSKDSLESIVGRLIDPKLTSRLGLPEEWSLSEDEDDKQSDDGDSTISAKLLPGSGELKTEPKLDSEVSSAVESVGGTNSETKTTESPSNATVKSDSSGGGDQNSQGGAPDVSVPSAPSTRQASTGARPNK